MQKYDVGTIEREGRLLGWIRLMDYRGTECNLSVVCWASKYQVIIDGAVYSSVTTLKRGFDVVACEVALALLRGMWIDGYELPEGWVMGMRFAIRPLEVAPDATKPTSIAVWLDRRAWSLREAALRTGLSESSLRRWRDGWKMVKGERVAVAVPAYAERMIEVVDDLLARGVDVARWEPCQMDAPGFGHWVDRWPRSQARSAEMLGATKSQVSAWVNGRAAVPVYISRLMGLIVMLQRLPAGDAGSDG